MPKPEEFNNSQSSHPVIESGKAYSIKDLKSQGVVFPSAKDLEAEDQMMQELRTKGVPMKELLKNGADIKVSPLTETGQMYQHGDIMTPLIARKREIDEQIDRYENINDDEKEYLKWAALTFDKEDFVKTATTMQGLDPKQQEDTIFSRVMEGAVAGATTVGSMAGVASVFTPVSALATGIAVGGGALVGGIRSGLTDQKRYYLDDRGVAVPLGIGEMPPEGAKIESLFGNQLSASDDTYATTLGKSIYNSFINIGKAVPQTANLLYGLTTGQDSSWMNDFSAHVETLKFDTNPDANKSVFSVNGEDGVDFTPNPHNMLRLTGEVIGSLAQFIGGSNMVGALSGSTKAAQQANLADDLAQMAGKPLTISQKLAKNNPFTNKEKWMVSSMISLSEASEAARVAGIEGRLGYAFTGGTALVVGAIEMLIGGQEMRVANKRKIFNDVAEDIKIKTKRVPSTQEGRLTVGIEDVDPESINSIFNSTVKHGMRNLALYGKNAVKEAGGEALEESTQTLFSQFMQVMYDNLGHDGNKYGTIMMGPKERAELYESALGGFLGGSAGALTISAQRERNQNEEIFRHVKTGTDKNLKTELGLVHGMGRITDEQYQSAINKIDVFKSYHDQTKDLKIEEDDQRELFESLWKIDHASKKAAENPESTKPLDIARRKAYEDEVKLSQNKVNSIIKKAQQPKEDKEEESTELVTASEAEVQQPTPEAPELSDAEQELADMEVSGGQETTVTQEKESKKEDTEDVDHENKIIAEKKNTQIDAVKKELEDIDAELSPKEEKDLEVEKSDDVKSRKEAIRERIKKETKKVQDDFDKGDISEIEYDSLIASIGEKEEKEIDDIEAESEDATDMTKLHQSSRVFSKIKPSHAQVSKKLDTKEKILKLFGIKKDTPTVTDIEGEVPIAKTNKVIKNPLVIKGGMLMNPGGKYEITDKDGNKTQGVSKARSIPIYKMKDKNGHTVLVATTDVEDSGKTFVNEKTKKEVSKKQGITYVYLLNKRGEVVEGKVFYNQRHDQTKGSFISDDLQTLVNRLGLTPVESSDSQQEQKSEVETRTVNESYSGINVVEDNNIKSNTGEVGAAQFDRNSNTIKINRDLLKKKFEEKAWTKSRKQADGTYSKQLKSDQFKTYQEFELWVLEHEYQHTKLSFGEFTKLNSMPVTLGEYEDEINRRAFESLKEETKVEKDDFTDVPKKEGKAAPLSINIEELEIVSGEPVLSKEDQEDPILIKLLNEKARIKKEKEEAIRNSQKNIGANFNPADAIKVVGLTLWEKVIDFLFKIYQLKIKIARAVTDPQKRKDAFNKAKEETIDEVMLLAKKEHLELTGQEFTIAEEADILVNLMGVLDYDGEIKNPLVAKHLEEGSATVDTIANSLDPNKPNTLSDSKDRHEYYEKQLWGLFVNHQNGLPHGGEKTRSQLMEMAENFIQNNLPDDETEVKKYFIDHFPDKDVVQAWIEDKNETFTENQFVRLRNFYKSSQRFVNILYLNKGGKYSLLFSNPGYSKAEVEKMNKESLAKATDKLSKKEVVDILNSLEEKKIKIIYKQGGLVEWLKSKKDLVSKVIKDTTDEQDTDTPEKIEKIASNRNFDILKKLAARRVDKETGVSANAKIDWVSVKQELADELAKSSFVADIIQADIDAITKITGIDIGQTQGQWEGFLEYYSKQAGFDSYERYVAERIVNGVPDNVKTGAGTMIPSARLTEIGVFHLSKFFGLDGKAIRKHFESPGQVGSQLTTIGRHFQSSSKNKGIAKRFTTGTGKNVQSGEFNSFITDVKKRLSNSKTKSRYKNNPFYQRFKNGIKFFQLDAMKDAQTHHAEDRSGLNQYDYDIIRLTNYFNSENEEFAGAGNYLFMLDQQADSSKKIMVAVEKLKGLKDSDIKRKEIRKKLSGLKYWDSKKKKSVPYFATDADLDKAVAREISQWTKKIAFLRSKNLIPTTENSSSEEALEYTYNQIYNWLHTNEFFRGTQSRGLNYPMMIKRKQDGKGMTLLKGIPGGIGETQKVMVIDDPKVLIDFGYYPEAAETELHDGGNIIMPWFNEQIRISSGGMFANIVKAFTYTHIDGAEYLIKANDITYPSLESEEGKKFYQENPLARELVEYAWAQKEKTGKPIDRIVFSSGAKIKSEGDVNVMSWKTNGDKVEGFDLPAVPKTLDIDNDDFKIMLDLSNRGQFSQDSIPSQIINILRSTPQGDKIDEILSKASLKKEEELLKLFAKGPDEIIKWLTEVNKNSDDVRFFEDLKEKGALTIDDSIVRSMVNKYFKNALKKKILDFQVPKALLTQGKVLGMNLGHTHIDKKSGEIVLPKKMLPASARRSALNPNGVEVGDNAFVVRVPSGDLNSFSLVEVAGFLPEEMGSTIVTDAGISIYSGSDYDGDQLHVWTQYRNRLGRPIKGGDEYHALMNEVFGLMKDVYTDVNNFERITEKTSVEKKKEYLEEFYKEDSLLNPAFPSSWSRMVHANSDASTVISITASVLKVAYNLSPKNVTLKKSIYFPIYDSEKRVWTGRDTELTGWNSDVKKKNKNYSILNAHLNHAADSVKNGTLELMNKYASTAGQFDTFLSMDSDMEDSLIEFMHTPGMKDFIELEQYFSSVNMNISRSQMLDRIAEAIWTGDPNKRIIDSESRDNFNEAWTDRKNKPPRLTNKSLTGTNAHSKLSVLRLFNTMSRVHSDVMAINKIISLTNEGPLSYGEHLDGLRAYDKIKSSPESLYFIEASHAKEFVESPSMNRARINIDLSKKYYDQHPISTSTGKKVLENIIHQFSLSENRANVYVDSDTYDKIYDAFDKWLIIQALDISEDSKSLTEKANKWFEALPADSPIREYLKIGLVENRLELSDEAKKNVDDIGYSKRGKDALATQSKEDLAMLTNYLTKVFGWRRAAWSGGFYEILPDSSKKEVSQKLNDTLGKLKTEHYFTVKEISKQIMLSNPTLIPEADILWKQVNLAPGVDIPAGERYNIVDKGEVSLPVLPLLVRVKKTKDEGNTWEYNVYEKQFEIYTHKGKEYEIEYYDKKKVISLDSAEFSPVELKEDTTESNETSKRIVANIPQNKISGIESYGSTIEASDKVKKVLGPNPHSIDMIVAGLRTRTTRSEKEMNKYGIKVGDRIRHFGKSADGTTKEVYAIVTAIHKKGTPGWKETWKQEGWRESDFSVIERYIGNAAAIEFVIDSNESNDSSEIEYTPENITLLKENEIFVFGSNTDGYHGKGAALIARTNFGATQGIAEGFMGKSYAIVTKDLKKKQRGDLNGWNGLDYIDKQIAELISFAYDNPKLKLYVTKIGTDLAGWTIKEIGSLFGENGIIPKNIILPIEFEPFADRGGESSSSEQQKDSSDDVPPIDYMKDDPSTPADPEQIEIMREKFAKLFPHVKAFSSAEDFQKVVDQMAPGHKLDMDAWGASIGNAYWINPESPHQEAIFHEYAHIFWAMLPDTDLVKRKLLSFYGSEEAAVLAIGKAGAELVKLESASKSVFAKVSNWMKHFWSRVRAMIWKDASVDHYTKVMAQRIWKGTDTEIANNDLKTFVLNYMKKAKGQNFFAHEETFKKVFDILNKNRAETEKAKTFSDFNHKDLLNTFLQRLDLDEEESFWQAAISQISGKQQGAMVDSKFWELEAKGLTQLPDKPNRVIRNEDGEKISYPGSLDPGFKMIKPVDLDTFSVAKTGQTIIRLGKLPDRGAKVIKETKKEYLKYLEDVIEVSRFLSEKAKTQSEVENMGRVLATKWSYHLKKKTEYWRERGFNMDGDAMTFLTSVTTMMTTVATSHMLMEQAQKEESASLKDVNRITVRAIAEILDPGSVTDLTGFNTWVGKGDVIAPFNAPLRTDKARIALRNQVYAAAYLKSIEGANKSTIALQEIFNKLKKLNVDHKELTYKDSKTDIIYFIKPNTVKYNALIAKGDVKSLAIAEFSRIASDLLTEYTPESIKDHSMFQVSYAEAGVQELMKRKLSWYEIYMEKNFPSSKYDMIHIVVPGEKDPIRLRDYRKKLSSNYSKTKEKYTFKLRYATKKAKEAYDGKSTLDAAGLPIIRTSARSMVRGLSHEANKLSSDDLITPLLTRLKQLALISALGDNILIMEFAEGFASPNNTNEQNIDKFIKQLNQRDLYGIVPESKLPTTVEIVTRFLIQYTGLKFMALNFGAVIPNAFGGLAQNLRDLGLNKLRIGIARSFDPTQVRFNKDWKKMYFETKIVNILREQKILVINHDWTTTNSEEFAGALKQIAFAPTTFIEFMNHSMTIAGLMETEEYDAYNQDGTVKKGHEQNAMSIDRIIQLISLSQDIHGSYHTLAKRLAGSITEGRAILQLRTWMFDIWNIHMMKDQPVHSSDKQMKGIVRSGADVVWGSMKYLNELAKTKSHEEAKKMFYSLKPVDQQNLQKLGYEISLMTLIAMVLAGAGGDDDDKRRLSRMWGDVAVVYDINNYIYTFKGGLPVFSVIVDALTTLQKLAENGFYGPLVYEKDTKYGEKGDSKIPLLVVNMLPLNQIIKKQMETEK